MNGWLDADTDYYTVWSSLQHSTSELAVPRAALRQQLPSQSDKPAPADQSDHIAPTKADGSAHVAGLAPSAEVYSLKWESQHLHAFGAFLQSMTVKVLAKGRLTLAAAHPPSNSHTAGDKVEGGQQTATSLEWLSADPACH